MSTPSSSSGYDHRWLLFLIPIILLFFGLIFLVWYVVRRRRRQKRRRSVLRNRALVAAEAEKRREREEQRMSRGHSMSSRWSGMFSSKGSTVTKSNSQGGRSSRLEKAIEHSGSGSEIHQNPDKSTQLEARILTSDVEKDCATDVKVGERAEDGGETLHVQLVDGKVTGAANDLERQAESDAVIKNAGWSRVNIAEEERPQSRPTMADRKELSVIGETNLTEDEERSAEESSPSEMATSINQQRTTGQVSRNNSTISPASNNPFACPTESSNDASTSSPATPFNVSPVEDTREASTAPAIGLGRRFSDVIRLRQPSPATLRARSPTSPEPSFLRSSSRASRKSSTKSLRRNESPVEASSSGHITPSGSWTYTSKAALWKSSSTDVGPSSSVSASSTLDTPTIKVQEPFDEATEDQRKAPTSNAGATDQENNLDLTVSRTTLVRKTSNGVAGSRFVESFDK
ncbi:hypothetical protein CBS101457_005616 [Exobasidium rhododendri]|nr:hypothetical protein CBS101457_005616 [Exobasidium rhododendri]